MAAQHSPRNIILCEHPFEELKRRRLFARGRFVPFRQFNPNRDRAVRRLTAAKRIVAAPPCLKSSPRWQQVIEFPIIKPFDLKLGEG